MGNSTEWAIDVQNVSKTYKLYDNPRTRLKDILGLLRDDSRYSLHPALDSVSLQVRKGERVGIIGRNGAGKSTLLKIISGTVEPTSGSVSVYSQARAILQIGTGFHPDFTGRDNVESYLAQLGVSEQTMPNLMAEVIDFAEIDEFIDQPLKTYSTGMAARLMFSATTVVAPELLVLDEILSVGDAYFTQKSMERIESLCAREGSTLLLVSHDIYSIAQICDRIVWIDKGQILMDSDPNTVTKRYETSIRDQNEKRLRQANVKQVRENLAEEDVTHAPYFCQIRCEGYRAIDADLPIRRISFLAHGAEIASLVPHDERACQRASLVLDSRQSNWDATLLDSGEKLAAFTTHGSVHHRAAFNILVSEDIDLETVELSCEIEYLDSTAMPLKMELFIKENRRAICTLQNVGSGEWRSESQPLTVTNELEEAPEGVPRYGTQAFRFTNVEFLDETGAEKYLYKTGDRMQLRLSYEINDRDFDQRPTIQVNFLKDGAVRTHRFILQGQNFSYADGRVGTIDFVADPVVLTGGKYLVNVVAMQEGGYSNRQNKTFFTINPNLLDHHSRAYEIEISPTHYTLVDDTVFLHPVTITKDGEKVFEGLNYLEEEIVDLLDY